jgi:hypothetical protein
MQAPAAQMLDIVPDLALCTAEAVLSSFVPAGMAVLQG